MILKPHFFKNTFFHGIFLIILYLIIRLPLINSALWHDEIYFTSTYLAPDKSETAIEHEDAVSAEYSWLAENFNWSNDWKRQISLHPPSIFIVYAIWIKIFGDSEISLHIPPIIAGIFTVIVLYLLGALIFDKNVGFLAALALTFSASHITYSVMTIPAIFEMCIFLISLYFFSKFMLIEDKKYFNLLLFCNVIGILIYYHYFFYIIIQTIIFWFSKQRLKITMSYFAITLLSLFSFLWFVLYNYQQNSYSFGHWQLNDIKTILKNITYLPITFSN